MAVILDDLPTLRRQVEELQRNADRAQGAYDQILKKLQEDFGAKSLIEAKALLVELQDEEREAFRSYNKARKQFDEKWSKTLQALKEDNE